eukprot:IDg4493t1
MTTVVPSPHSLPLSGVAGPPIVAGVAAGSGAVVLVVAIAVALCVRCGCTEAARSRYYRFDFGPEKAASIDTPVNSTKALRGGPSLKSLQVDDNSPRVSVTSDDAIAAPELENYDHIGGSGVGFLDERGNPIVRARKSDANRSDRGSFFEAVTDGESPHSEFENNSDLYATEEADHQASLSIQGLVQRTELEDLGPFGAGFKGTELWILPGTRH